MISLALDDSTWLRDCKTTSSAVELARLRHWKVGSRRAGIGARLSACTLFKSIDLSINA